MGSRLVNGIAYRDNSQGMTFMQVYIASKTYLQKPFFSQISVNPI